jgi:c-di-GMP-binding flagellar brake protein YcgR
MKLSGLPLGTKFGLEITSNQEHEPAVVLESTLIDICQPKTVFISMPTYHEKDVQFKTGAVWMLYFVFENKLFWFCAKYMQKETHDSTLCIKLLIDSQIEEIQRRFYYRVKCDLPMQLVKCDDQDKQVSAEDPKHQEPPLTSITHTLDISGGGLKASVPISYKQGESVLCHLILKEKRISIPGEVAWVRGHTSKEQARYYIGVSFRDTLTEDKEILLRFIFEQQRRQLMSGMGL